jgi:hypothetical protein
MRHLIEILTFSVTGKINRTSLKQRGQGPNTKADRRHAARVAQQKKRSEVYETTRVFEGKDGAPKIVVRLEPVPVYTFQQVFNVCLH